MAYYRRLPIFEYHAPTSVEETASMLEKYKGQARLLAGGTITVNQMKERTVVRPHVISLKKIGGLDTIAADPAAGLRLGAMALLQDVADSAAVREKCPLLATVCGLLGTPQIRNMGTIGGNVAIRFATSETLPALIALGASARLLSTGGERLVAVEELYREMKPGDLLTSLQIPAQKSVKTGYRKFAMRERFDYATVAAAVTMSLSGKTCKDLAIGLGGVSLPTMRAKAAEELLKGQAMSDALIKKAADAAAETASIGSDLMFSADYKKKVLAVMVERAIKDAIGG